MQILNLIATFTLLSVSTTLAHNNYFLPGDSFFSFTLTEYEESLLSADGKNEPLQVEYARLDNRFMACGNLGYTTLEISALSAKFRTNLNLAYSKIREYETALFRKGEKDGEEELIEWNPVVGLIYNKGKANTPLGLKYNENWQTEGHGYYGGFLTDGKSVAFDWREAANVAPLKLAPSLDPKIHLSNKGVVHRAIDRPLNVKASEIEIYLVGFLKKNSWVQNECLNLKNLAKGMSGAFYFKVTEAGFTFHEYENDRLKSYQFDSNWNQVEIKLEK